MHHYREYKRLYFSGFTVKEGYSVDVFPCSSYCKMPQESYFPFTSLWDLALVFIPDLCMLLKCMQCLLVASNLYFMAEVCTQKRKAETCYT